MGLRSAKIQQELLECDHQSLESAYVKAQAMQMAMDEKSAESDTNHVGGGSSSNRFSSNRFRKDQCGRCGRARHDLAEETLIVTTATGEDTSHDGAGTRKMR